MVISLQILQRKRPLRVLVFTQRQLTLAEKLTTTTFALAHHRLGPTAVASDTGAKVGER